jgi:hypothetical protein
MNLSDGRAFSADTIVALFTDSFAASEGAEEGALIGGLVTGFRAARCAGVPRPYRGCWSRC